MKYFVYKNNFRLKSADVWFADNEDEWKNINADVLHIWGFPSQIAGCICNKQQTLIIDLKKSEEEIFNDINKTVKYEINRSIKENIKINMYTSKQLDEKKELVDEFHVCYDEMYKEKGLDTRLNIESFERYIKNDMIYFSVASDEVENLVYHVYTYDNKKVRFLYSCSTFRASNDKKNIIGRANKFLHWEDMKYFKSIGIEQYDLGGIFSYENPNGIDKFKINFGGEPISYYNITCGHTLIGKIGALGLKIKK